MPKKCIFLFAFTEIVIGAVTLATTVTGWTTHASIKPLNVLLFVVISALISVSLGIGILLRWRYARKLLIFFAGWIILSKILIFAKILILCCELETTVSANLKNIISVVYHAMLIFYFHHPSIKKEFEP